MRTKGQLAPSSGNRGQKWESDGLRVDFQPQTLFIGWQAPPSAFNGATATTVVLELQGLGENLTYRRVFSLPTYTCVEVSCAEWARWQLTVLYGEATGPQLAVAVGEGPPNPARQETVYYAQTYEAGEYACPPGAFRVFTATALTAPQFSWRTPNVAGAAVSIPQLLTIGQETNVKGARFVLTVPASLVWEIRL